MSAQARRRWDAGWTLLQAASLEAVAGLVRLQRTCGEQGVALCEATLAVHRAQGAGGMPAAGQQAAGGQEGTRATPPPARGRR